MTQRNILLIILSLLGFVPFVNGQSNQSTNNKITFKKVTILKDTGSGPKQKLIDNYAQEISNWAQTNQNGSSVGLPSIPEELKNVNVSIENIQLNDTINTVIKITNLENPSSNKSRIYKRNNTDAEKLETNRPKLGYDMPPSEMGPPRGPNGEFGPPPSRDRRMKNKRKKRKDNEVVTQSRFSLGLLNVIGKNAPMAGGPDFTDMPNLDAGKSLQIGFEHSWGINIIKGKVRAWIGIAYDIQNYRFEDNQVRLVNRGNQFEYYIDNSGQNPGQIADKSKLVTNYLGIPISVGFQNKKRNPTFSMKVGIQAGTLVRSHSKVRYLNGDKEKYFTDFGLNKFVVSPFAVLQFKHLGIYAKYGMTDVFKRNPNAPVKPNHNLSIGFTLTTNIN